MLQSVIRLFVRAVPVVALSAAAFAADDRLTGAQATQACTESESWRFPDSFRKEARKAFERGYRNSDLHESIVEQIPWRGHADPAIRAAVEYWTARALYEAGLVHAAHRNFNALVAAPSRIETAGFQAAALACLNRLHEEIPALRFTEAAEKALLAGAKRAEALSADRARALYKVFRVKYGRNRPLPELQAIVAALEGSPVYRELARSAIFVRENRTADAAVALRAALAQPAFERELSVDLKQAKNDRWLALGRMYYSVRDYKNAILAWRKVDQTANAMPNALEDLSWAYLRAKMYAESMAAVASLQVGGLKRSFVPEASTVAAIALYELCQYPESLKATKLFRHLYAPSYRWIGAWEKDRKAGRKPDYYGLVVRYLKGEETPVPDPIATEWIRTPAFIAYQAELNSALDGRAAIAAQLKRRSGEVSSDEREAKAQRLVQSLLASEDKYLKSRAQKIVSMIGAELDAKTGQLARRLAAAAENIQLIEIDLYNRASEDIIFKTSHPEFAELSRKLSPDEVRKRKTAVMDWGEFDAQSGRSAEVWDDEIGRLNTNLPNACKKKEKYLEQKENEQRESAPSSGLGDPRELWRGPGEPGASARFVRG